MPLVSPMRIYLLPTAISLGRPSESELLITFPSSVYVGKESVEKRTADRSNWPVTPQSSEHPKISIHTIPSIDLEFIRLVIGSDVLAKS